MVKHVSKHFDKRNQQRLTLFYQNQMNHCVVLCQYHTNVALTKVMLTASCVTEDNEISIQESITILPAKKIKTG